MNTTNRSNAVAPMQQGAIDLTQWGHSQEMVDIIKDQIAREASNAELAVFLMTCKRTQLDPFAKQIWLVPRWDSNLGRKVRQTQVSIDGARLTAQRSGEYEGQVGPWWCGADGEWKSVWLDKAPPAAARVGVMRKGFRKPLYAVALWSSYCQYTKEKAVTSMWAQYGTLMLAKCAEMLALRKAFPMELSGLYIEDESDENPPADVVDVEHKPAPDTFIASDKTKGQLVQMCKENGVTFGQDTVDWFRNLHQSLNGVPIADVFGKVAEACEALKKTQPKLPATTATTATTKK